MSKRLMREGLSHTYPGMKKVDLFKMVDATGGWPNGFQFFGFVHSCEREGGFCDSDQNDGWWTVVVSADDYYTFKLTEAGLQRIADAAVKSYINYTVNFRPAASTLQIKDSRESYMDLSHMKNAKAQP